MMAGFADDGPTVDVLLGVHAALAGRIGRGDGDGGGRVVPTEMMGMGESGDVVDMRACDSVHIVVGERGRRRKSG